MTTPITYGLLKPALPGIDQIKFSAFERFINPVCVEYGIYEDLDKVHFLANITHECLDFNQMVEGAIYSSADRILQIFPKYFDKGTNRILAEKYVRNPQLLSYVYANRMGNGPESSGDGFRYRGRGPIMATGKSLYQEISGLGIDFVKNPDELLNPEIGLKASGYFWKTRGCSAFALADDTAGARRRVNGGTIGLDDVTSRVIRLKRAFKLL